MNLKMLSRIAAVAFAAASMIWHPEQSCAVPTDCDRICGRAKDICYLTARERRVERIEGCKEFRGGSCPTWRREDFREMQIDEQIECNREYNYCTTSCPL